MSEMIVLRLEGEAGFLLINRASGTVEQLDAADAPALDDAEGTSRFRGVAEAYALPALTSIPSRKHYLS